MCHKFPIATQFDCSSSLLAQQPEPTKRCNCRKIKGMEARQKLCIVSRFALGGILKNIATF